ncbi:MAG: single-stranded DNA-binding protein [Acholeplasmatales bacterium]|jgi:single-strand DNA-binding protein|nr:single-stranded DNA-binding protein [Acholeplasmatales bacterium]
MNSVVLSGRLVRDPKLEKSANGIPYTNFTIAVKRNYGDEVDFIDCSAFRGVAEIITKYLSKGDMAMFMGEINISNYETQDGERRKSMSVLVNRVEFMSVKNEISISNDDNDELAEYESDIVRDDSGFYEDTTETDIGYNETEDEDLPF